MRRFAVLFAVVLLIAATSAWLLLVPEPGRVGRSSSRPSVGLRNAGIVLRHRGEKQAEIKAELVEVSADGTTTTFTGSPRAEVFVEGRPTLVLTAQRVVLNRSTQDIQVEGGIRITTARGEIITAPRASWQQQIGVLDLVDGVEVRFPIERSRPP